MLQINYDRRGSGSIPLTPRFVSLIFFVLSLFPYSGVGQIHQYHDLRYAEGDSVYHLLDLEVPESSDPLPLVVFVHGGGWQAGNKSNFRSRMLLDYGYAAASINYRLSQIAT